MTRSGGCSWSAVLKGQPLGLDNATSAGEHPTVAVAPVLTGEGFVLRALSQADASAWKAGEDREQIRWFEAPGPSPIENIVAAIGRWQAGWAEDSPLRQWGIWSEDRLAGGVELRVRDDRRANVSYVVFPEWRRRGYASGAVSAVAAWANENLDVSALVAVVDELNVASRGVVEAAGFHLEGRAEPWEYSESGVMLRYVGTTQP